MSKPREVVPVASSAGKESAQIRATNTRGLPFNPHDYTVRGHLARKLLDVDDVHTLNRLQAFDSRNTAAALYERRIDEIQGAPDGASPPPEE